MRGNINFQTTSSSWRVCLSFPLNPICAVPFIPPTYPPGGINAGGYEFPDYLQFLACAALILVCAAINVLPVKRVGQVLAVGTVVQVRGMDGPSMGGAGATYLPWVVQVRRTFHGWCRCDVPSMGGAGATYLPWVVQVRRTFHGWCRCDVPSMGGAGATYLPWVVQVRRTFHGWCRCDVPMPQSLLILDSAAINVLPVKRVGQVLAVGTVVQVRGMDGMGHPWVVQVRRTHAPVSPHSGLCHHQRSPRQASGASAGRGDGAAVHSFPVSSSASFPVSPSASFPVSPSASFPVSPSASFPVSPSASFPVSPSASFPVSPSASFPVSPSASFPVSPSASFPVSPSASFPMSSSASFPVSPSALSAPFSPDSCGIRIRGGMVAGLLMSQYVLYTFDAAAHMSEEAKRFTAFLPSCPLWLIPLQAYAVACAVVAGLLMSQYALYAFNAAHSHIPGMRGGGRAPHAYAVVAGLLMSQYALYAFDAAAHTSEEAKRSDVTTPFAMIAALSVICFVEWGVIVALTFCIQMMRQHRSAQHMVAALSLTHRLRGVRCHRGPHILHSGLFFISFFFATITLILAGARTSVITLSLPFPTVSSTLSSTGLCLVSGQGSPSLFPVAPGEGSPSLFPVAPGELQQGTSERHSVHQQCLQPIPPSPARFPQGYASSCDRGLPFSFLWRRVNSSKGYALSRDRGLPLSFLWRRVNADKVPVNAIACTSAIAIVFLMPLLGGSVAYFAVTGMATVGWFGAYGVPVFFRIIQSDKDFAPGPFYLPNYIGHTGG
ncbi:unnamed protein product [Closterium sp. Yama58-4]|nr:unnamed protein product [Closterium sp. Yama58-4]